MKKNLIFLAIFIQSSLCLLAQQPSNEINESFSYSSKILSGDREIWIHVPKIDKSSLDNPQSIFPVIYVLDGEHSFNSVVSISQALARASLMPNVIVVGISGEKREYDYSPADLKVDYMKTGGGKNFLAFLSKELVPYINGNYPSSKHNTIVGHSIGAMFSLFALAENSPSFDSFLAISPSLWWDGESLAKDWIERLNSYSPNTYKTAFVTMANEKTMGPDCLKMHNQYLSYKAQLKGRGKFKIGFMDLFEEDHLSTVTPALHHGLKYLYQNWNLDTLYTSNDFDGLKESLKDLSKIYRFNVAPDYASLMNMGRSFYEKEDYKKSIEIYEIGLKTYSEGLQMNGYLAQAYLKDGQIEKAKEYFNKGLDFAISKQSPMISWFRDELNRL